MKLLTLLRPSLRWINLFPLWRAGRVKVWGNRLRAPTFDRWLCLLLHQCGLMGKADRVFMLAHLRPGMTVVDIGANQGLYTLLFSRTVGPAGKVYAFEPDDMLYAALEENLASNKAGNVTSYHLALGSKRGAMTLYRSLLNSGDNRLTDNGLVNTMSEPVQIRVERLNDVLAGQRIDFIKMDVQGWEMEVFRGMEPFLDDPCNLASGIYFEFWPRGLRDAGSDPTEVLLFLTTKGFCLFQTVGNTSKLIKDLSAFAHSIPPDHYMNLYAQRTQVA